MRRGPTSLVETQQGADVATEKRLGEARVVALYLELRTTRNHVPALEIPSSGTKWMLGQTASTSQTHDNSNY